MAKKSHIIVRPATDIIRSEKKVEIILNIPGVHPDQVKLEIFEYELVLHAHMNVPHKVNEHIICLEFTDCEYYTRFGLSEEIDVSSLKAHMETGVLTVQLDYIKGKEPTLVPIEF